MIVLAHQRHGSGPPLVLVHGSGSDSSRWQPVIPELRRRFTLYCVDRRGHGASGDGRRYRIDYEFGDLARFIASIGERPIAVVAHSYGALCALGAACRSDRIGRLVLYEPPLPMVAGDYYPPGAVGRMRRAIAHDDIDGAAALFAAEVMGMSEAQIATMRRLGHWREIAARAPVLFRELAGVERYAARIDRFAECRAAALLLVGSESPPEYHATAAALSRTLPRARTLILEGQGHGAIDGMPERFAEAACNFLAETGDP